MKKLLILTLIFFTSISQADFIDAQKYYENKDYAKAYFEFKQLAKLGNQKSQYNVALMNYKGQGTDKNAIEAYAWASLVTDIAKYQPLFNIIGEELSPNDLIQAQKLAKNHNVNYAYENSKVILGPIEDNNPNSTKTANKPNVVSDKRVAPDYPTNLALKGIQGWAKIMFNIYPDGSVRDLQIVEELPAKTFGKAAIQSVEKYRFHFEQNGEVVSMKEPYSATQRIDFKLHGHDQILSTKHKSYLEKVKTNADNGDVYAQYEYAAIQDRYYLDKDIDQKQMNQWLFNASQEGIADAQYRLGKNIYFGKDCKIEKQKGLDWVMQAAQIGNLYAQYMVYHMLKNETVINQSDATPFYWLSQAAKNGLSIAQLNYAKEISSKSNPSDNELKLAQKYLKNYSKETYRTIQWYQISALIDAKLNNHKKAYSKIKSAYRLAKVYGWDLTELADQKKKIKSNKNS
jgi:TonB family protein